MPLLRRWRFSILLAVGTLLGFSYLANRRDSFAPPRHGPLLDTTSKLGNGDQRALDTARLNGDQKILDTARPDGDQKQPDKAKPEGDQTVPDISIPNDDEPMAGKARPTNAQQRYPVTSFIALPSSAPSKLPRVQGHFPAEDERAKATREKRRRSVEESFQHAWTGYKQNSWLRDELAPVSGKSKDVFGGWAATLVDTLDTLWIMGLYDDFEDAVDAVSKIDFTKTEQYAISVFETTIRYLGGLLGAYDVSDGRYKVLLEKAVEVADVLYGAFDTPNRMPVARWDMHDAASSPIQVASSRTSAAEIGSLSLEFTRLSQITKDPKYFDAIQRISNALDLGQNTTKLPGMWPVMVNAAIPSFSGDNSFTLGGMADSLYEYLPKEHALLGSSTDQYRRLYEGSIDVVKEHLFFRPMNKENRNVLLSGEVKIGYNGFPNLSPRTQHLTCFAGGMVGLGAKLFERPDELDTARKLVDGCVWAYESMVTGIMPETFTAIPCKSQSFCPWDEEIWRQAVLDRVYQWKGQDDMTEGEKITKKIKDSRLVPGIPEILDRRYLLRPEAIESVFILYRITADAALQEQAWKMFTNIEKYTRTNLAHAAIDDVSRASPQKTDSMESFWLAETLKYFYLIFSEPDLVSLDDYVLSSSNTEAHTFKRPL
ncbi:MAG: hypothetical protein M1837_003988 [Sclerophora amabilis]|nr:MAG: hypothetical protein M1837_003988 [Sclerophora amabilis]